MTTKERTWTLVSVSVLVAMLGFIVYHEVYPPLTAKQGAAGSRATEQKLRTEIASLNSQAVAAQKTSDLLVWKVKMDDIGPAALDLVTAAAKTHKVTVVAFRPQKPIELVGLTQMAFTVSLDGTYPSVSALVNDLEKSESKLTVSLVQLAAQDGASDRVNATIGISAFLVPVPKDSNRESKHGSD